VHSRFYAPTARGGAVVTLPVEEAQHLTRVLRLTAGDRVRVFNGRGQEFDAIVDTTAKQAVTVRVGEPHLPAPEPRIAVSLVQAVLKGDKMDDVIRDAVMLGVTAVQPIIATRSEASLATLDRGHRRERWERIAISSTKQCGRAVVPRIADVVPFSHVPSAISALALPGPALMLVEPSATVDAVALTELDLPAPVEATLLVGPEGGWTAHELSLAQSTCRFVSIGARTLRADAMALVALSAVFAMWKEF
jgi:16S rRNA (uracil1498-N3)-methyltransferase